jgi:L-fuculose-phosphate aldolase
MNVNKDLIILGKKLSKYVVGFEGNVSKMNQEGIHIKASGTRLSDLCDNNIVTYDLNGKQINNFEKKGSMEISFHSYLLKKFNVNYVAHTHPTNTLKIVCSNYLKDFAYNRLFPDQVIFNGEKSVIIPYAKPGLELTEEIKNILDGYNEPPKSILLEKHGIITMGKTIDKCLISTEICEKSAEIYLGAKLLGVNFLNRIDVENLINDKNEKYRESKI